MGDFFCLYPVQGEDCLKNNILAEVFNIQSSFDFNHEFYRTVDGTGAAIFDKKYSIALRGKGSVSFFEKQQDFSFFSSLLFEKKTFSAKDRKYYCSFNKENSFYECFKKKLHENLDDEQGDFGFPILNVMIIKFSVSKFGWKMELKEK